MENVINQNKDDTKIVEVICIQIILSALQNILLPVIPGITEYNNEINLVYMVVIVFLYISLIPSIIRYNLFSAVITIIFFTFIILSTLIIHSENTNLIMERLHLMIWNMALFIVCLTIYNYKILLNYLYDFSPLIVLIGAAFLFTKVLRFNSVSDIMYSMSLGYHMLLPISIITAKITLYKVNNRIFLYDLLLIIIGLLTIISGGSRGPIFCYIVLLSVILIKKSKTKMVSAKKILLALIIIGITLIIIFFSNEFANWVNEVFNNFGIYSRTLFLFINGSVFESLGRSTTTFPITLELINSNPLLGVGIRSPLYAWFGYPHNIILELLVQFGVIIGGFLLSIIVVICFVGVLQKKNVELGILFIVFFSISLPALMVSGTVWENGNFWICMALGSSSLKTSLRTTKVKNVFSSTKTYKKDIGKGRNIEVKYTEIEGNFEKK